MTVNYERRKKRGITEIRHFCVVRCSTVFIIVRERKKSEFRGKRKKERERMGFADVNVVDRGKSVMRGIKKTGRFNFLFDKTSDRREKRSVRIVNEASCPNITKVMAFELQILSNLRIARRISDKRAREKNVNAASATLRMQNDLSDCSAIFTVRCGGT